MEVFKEIEGFEGKYLVSNFGRVKSVCSYAGKKERILKQYVNPKRGYLFVCLSRGLQADKGRYKTIDVHRLVAQAFIPNPQNLGYVNHKDENKLNNRVENLEWCTAEYNTNYGTRNERSSKKVYKYTMSGDLVAEYPSITKAAEDNGASAGNISSCCNGRLKSAYGFIWKFGKGKEMI